MVVHGYVLVGGLSTRMGKDKATLVHQGQALALRTAQTLKQGGCHQVWLVGKPNSPAQELGFPFLEDRTGDQHPLAGVATALTHHTPAVICPCDLPHLMPGDVKLLLDHGGPCIAWDGQHTQPLLAVLHQAQRQHAQDALTEGRSVHRFVQALPRVLLRKQALHNANRPEDMG